VGVPIARVERGKMMRAIGCITGGGEGRKKGEQKTYFSSEKKKGDKGGETRTQLISIKRGWK